MVHLAGKTEFDLDTLAASVYQVAQLEVTRPSDIHPGELSEHEKLLSALMCMVGVNGPAASSLRSEMSILRFLTYQFLFEYRPVIDRYLQSSCLDWVALYPLVLVQGKLSNWIGAMYQGTNSEDPFVVHTFCEVFIYLESVVKLPNVLSRFYKDPVVIDGQKLFRLRYQ